MKIERLHFKNINSLKGEHEVNFNESPLSTGGLFAIIGPTGSGKSTLLDAICLALYGRTPRISSVNKNKIEQDGSILTKYQNEAFAKVQFSCNAGTFISTWSISTNRNGNLREYDMDLRDSLTETPFSEKKTEVLAEIQRLVGLSYDQFVKSVLLSQGEFATLLQSNEKDRSELLEKITNTSIYRQIGIKVYEKYKSFDAKISEQKTVLNDLNEKLLDEEKLQDMQAQKAELELTESKQQKTLLQYEKDLEQFTTKEKLDQELKTESDTLMNLTTAFDEFQNNNDKKLKLHAKTLDFEEELLSYNTLVEKRLTESETLAQLEKDKSRIQNNVESLKTEIENLLKEQVDDVEIESQLHAFLKTYQKLENERQIRRSEYKSKLDVLDKDLEVLGLKFKNQSIEDFESQLQTQLQSSEEKIELLNVELKADETLEETLKTQHQLLSRLKEAKHEDNSIQDLKERIHKLDIQLKNESDELLKFPKLISEQEAKLVVAEKEVKHLETKKENQTLRLEVENLRKTLTKNEACPVCGSTDHPFADHSPAVDSELSQKLKAAKRTRELTSNALAKLNAENVSISKRIDELENELQSIKRSLKNKQEAFEVDYASVLSQLNNNSLEEFETRIENYINSLERFKTLDKDIKALHSSLSSLEALENIQHQGSELKAKMDELYQGKNLDGFVSKLKSTWVRLNSNLVSNQTSIQKEQETLSAIEEQLEKLQKNLEVHIKSSAFSSITEANACRMKSADYQVKVKKQQELSERLQIQKEKINGIKKQLDHLKFEYFTQKSEAKTAIALLKEKAENTKTELEEVNRQLKNNTDRKERIKEIEERIAKDLKANKKWELLNNLIGSAKGDVFNKYAQDLSLQRLILLGNKRLKHLNERYELDRYLPNEDKEQLYVIDHHMGGMRRSVKTLSGGETFLMSLALALGLSDLASRNVEINSLFIDEGFGTLDPETLDLTLDTLERLQAESNKTIGIISHVSILKERIQTQIVLNRNAQGYSQLKVVG